MSKSPITLNAYTPSEEKLNIASHGLGFLLSLAALAVLFRKSVELQSFWHWMGYMIYGFSQIVVFGASTLYHSATNPRRRYQLKILDHAAIYISIAGTYTPFTLIVIRNDWGWPVFITVWIMALAGMTLKIFYAGRYKVLSTIGYVAMGWLMVIVIRPLMEHLALAGLLWIAAGGILYTLGAVLYQIGKIPYNHAIFHFFVLGAAICHFIAVFEYAV
jgi:hemolysin III